MPGQSFRSVSERKLAKKHQEIEEAFSKATKLVIAAAEAQRIIGEEAMPLIVLRIGGAVIQQAGEATEEAISLSVILAKQLLYFQTGRVELTEAEELAEREKAEQKLEAMVSEASNAQSTVHDDVPSRQTDDTGPLHRGRGDLEEELALKKALRESLLQKVEPISCGNDLWQGHSLGEAVAPMGAAAAASAAGRSDNDGCLSYWGGALAREEDDLAEAIRLSLLVKPAAAAYDHDAPDLDDDGVPLPPNWGQSVASTPSVASAAAASAEGVGISGDVDSTA